MATAPQGETSSPAKGSPAYYEGTFSADDTTVTGEWIYPGGGGYGATMTRN